MYRCVVTQKAKAQTLLPGKCPSQRNQNLLHKSQATESSRLHGQWVGKPLPQGSEKKATSLHRPLIFRPYPRSFPFIAASDGLTFWRCWRKRQRRWGCKESVNTWRGSHKRARDGERDGRGPFPAAELAQGLSGQGSQMHQASFSLAGVSEYPMPYSLCPERGWRQQPLMNGLRGKQQPRHTMKEAEVYQQIGLSICLTSIPE